jgi:hypothetical protein
MLDTYPAQKLLAGIIYPLLEGRSLINHLPIALAKHNTPLAIIVVVVVMSVCLPDVVAV